MNLNNSNEISRPGAGREETQLAWVELVREQIASLRFGTVLITVHDSRVVQVEKNEKVRLDPPPSSKPSA